ncbi:hypothetical protein K3495_g7026 [Podosphaera aphanis]|nr:hypothetical protein K3495_g7026 [Podosphaera aphanis]
MSDGFLEWTVDQNLILTTEPDNPTHVRVNVLGLTFISSNLVLDGAESSIFHDADATSDHFPIASVIPWDNRFKEPLARLKFDTLDQRIFLTLLETAISEIPELPPTSEQKLLDTTALNLCTAIEDAYRGSARRAPGKGTGQPWWNDECRVAA